MDVLPRFWLFPIVTLVIGMEIGLSIPSSPLARFLTIRPAALSTRATDSDIAHADLSVMQAAWQTLEERYINPDKLVTQTLTMGAAEGLVRAVGDPYTVFMTPTDTKEFRDSLSGTLEGIGAELTEQDKLIVVASPLKGSPAEKAGVLPQDVIMQVDGKSVDGLSLSQVVEKIRGPKGSSVTLAVYRKGVPAPVKITIQRAAITIPSVESKLIDGAGGTVAYLDLTEFGDHTIDEAAKALKDFQGKKLKGFILDLRGNGGGYLDGAVDLVSMFLKEGKVVSVAQRDVPVQDRFTTGATVFPDTPMVVLVDAGSASASEITAGALQDNKRATVIGVKSFGKGTVQEVLDLPQGATMRVTIAKWLTPKGRDLSKEGIYPDYVVERSIEQMQKKQDPQLDAALSFLRTGNIPAALVTKAASSAASSSLSSK